MDEVLTIKEAAVYINRTQEVLAMWRFKQKMLPYIKDVSGRIRYRKQDLDAYLATVNATPTLIMPTS